MSGVRHRAEYFEANGVRQYLLHHPSDDPLAPVLLIVHGGPGFPDSNLAFRMRKMWGNLFNLVSWDQRGCGKTLAANGRPPEYPVTAQVILDDMRLIVQHLIESYEVGRIYLLGISWGTILCTLYVQKHPCDVKMYIGAGQFSNYYRNEVAAYDKAAEVARAAGDAKAISLLDSIAPYPEPLLLPDDKSMWQKARVLRKIQSRYGLVMKIDLFFAWSFFASPAFRFTDFWDFSARRIEINSELVKFLYEFEILDCGFVYDVPVCYILGENDYQSATPLAAEYFDQIQAPKKLLRIINGASHNMIFDQPDAVASALSDAKDLAEQQ